MALVYSYAEITGCLALLQLRERAFFFHKLFQLLAGGMFLLFQPLDLPQQYARAQLAGLELGNGRGCLAFCLPVRNFNRAARSFSLKDALST
jgi:hypothetical protein